MRVHVQSQEICGALDLTRSTIHTYLRRAFHRAGAEDRMELVLSAFALCQTRRREETAGDGKDRGVVGAACTARRKKARGKKVAPV